MTPAPLVDEAGASSPALGAKEAETIRFRPRRDLWDAVDFYLWFFFGTQAVGLLCIISALSEMTTKSVSSGALISLTMGIVYFGAGIAILYRHIRQRFALAYELTPSELVIHHGYKQVRVPYAEISGAHPNKICRMTTALKRATRVTFRRPYGGERGIDVAVVNDEGFLEGLAARCPHLRREGPRLVDAGARARSGC
ncbi:MAG: hypothetical protein ACT4QC_05040 [Planctomycetaceae bacterium]